jgi:plastocyanin
MVLTPPRPATALALVLGLAASAPAGGPDVGAATDWCMSAGMPRHSPGTRVPVPLSVLDASSSRTLDVPGAVLNGVATRQAGRTASGAAGDRGLNQAGGPSRGGATAGQATGTVRGRIDVRLPALGEPRPQIAALGLPPPAAAADRRRSVVYLETAPRAAFEGPAPRRARMDQRNETFVPHVLAITVGTVVDFPNNDATYHNVFSLSRAKAFDLGRYASGRSKSVTFDRPGIVRVFCDIHSHMNAFILVFSHRFFAVTDEHGRYRIDGIPPGTYTVTVWNEAVPRESRAVTIGSGGGEVELDVVLGRPGGAP